MIRLLIRNWRALAFGLLAFAVFFALPIIAFAQTAPAVAGLPINGDNLPGILQLVGVGAVPALLLVALVSFFAALFCALTPTPDPKTTWGRIYQVIEWLALITKNTKETGIPTVDALHQAEVALLDAPKLVVFKPTLSVPGAVAAPAPAAAPKA
ncbi:MAG TPA: hypothetical protein VN821_08625 [Candidatus Udaeobacter sp.]|nr:hypothetical protein [Candidatus Udaeobacter sp.]